MSSLRLMFQGYTLGEIVQDAVVGRHSDCDVGLRPDEVSRRHAKLIKDEDGFWYVRDLESKNGTFVNGARCAPWDYVLIKEGDEVSFGPVILTVSLKEACCA